MLNLLRRQGDYTRAVDAFEELLTSQDTAGDRRGAAFTLGELANVHYLRGDYPVALACLEASRLRAGTAADLRLMFRWRFVGGQIALDPERNASSEWRIDYLITEDTQPAPIGSSLGWLVQLDGDERRNEFLNAAWVKAVLPIRAGHELEALDWLAQANVEGEAGLGQPYPIQPGDPPTYQGKTIGDVLEILATELQTANTDMHNTLASEHVFETGFDPLATGFQPAEPYQIFDQWFEVLPTDQIVAVQVTYDPLTGQQL